MKHYPITDGQSLVSAAHSHGLPIPVYDDGYGPIWIHRDSMGISGIVRAQTWEDAYSICEDEFFPEADETVDELRAEYGFLREHVKVIRTRDGVERDATPADYPLTVAPGHDARPSWKFVRWEARETPDPDAWQDNDLFQEAYGFRPSGPRAGKRADGSPRDPVGHGIYAKDLNGDSLEPLTVELAAGLGITLTIEDNE